MLDIHALPWARKINLTSAFQDAQALMHCEPHNSSGYLYASALWSVRANAKQALIVVEKGIHEVSPTDPHYSLLEQHRKWAKERLQIRFDILADSPYDIFCAIVTHLNIDSLCESLVVSHTWRSKLLECPDPWRHLMVDRKLVLGQILPSPSGSILPLVAQHNEHLTLFGRFPRMNDKYLGLIEADKFPHLRSLRVHDSGKALQAIECVSYTVLRWTDELFWTQTTKLTKIDIHVYENSMTATSLQHLFRCSPDLQILKLMNCSPDTLEAIDGHCPKLVVLAVAPNILYDLEVVHDLFENAVSKVKPGQDGLRALILSGVRTVEPLRARLEKSRDTLEEIHVYTEHGDMHEGWLPLSRGILKSMKSLTLTMKTMVFTDDAAQNIMASRTLRHVYIACKTGLSLKARKLLRNQIPNVVIEDI
ncbi:hypothetical protein BJV82DRAFT_684842 [Fennellomyces sp. T-0311]|nr:hypothetical protein BJV82DRAFT_684842 [Fennellomyces sp. T-0311]